MELSIGLTIDDVKSISKCVTLNVHDKHYLIEVSVLKVNKLIVEREGNVIYQQRKTKEKKIIVMILIRLSK